MSLSMPPKMTFVDQLGKAKLYFSTCNGGEGSSSGFLVEVPSLAPIAKSTDSLVTIFFHVETCSLY